MKIYFYEVKDYEVGFIKKYSEEYGYEAAFTEELLSLDNAAHAEGYDAVSTLGFSRCDGKMMELLAKNGVKYFSTRTVGYEHVAVKEAKDCGISVFRANYVSSNVADFAVMLMLMLLRKCKVSVCRALVNNFSLDEMMGRDLRNLTVGVIGTGKIGFNVIRNLSGFGCRILCNDKFPNDEVRQYAEYCDLDRIYSECDIITLHTPLTAENFHMIDENAVQKMKAGVIIINTARGALIDTEALIHGIESEKIGGAGLDTIEGEDGICHVDIKTRISSKQNIFYLKQFPNVVYTPHIGFFTEEAVGQMVESAFKGVALAESGAENKFEIK
ncbi:MAG: lactate dehydrogenase [Clostridia bacterium]|nr:lactate dehydrogenase [Clostridia bacterium]